MFVGTRCQGKDRDRLSRSTEWSSPPSMGDPQDGRDQGACMADPDEEDEIDEIESPGNGMAHSRLPQAPDILPAKGKERPEEDHRREESP